MTKRELREAQFLILFRVLFTKPEEMDDQANLFFTVEKEDLRVNATDEEITEVKKKVSDIVAKLDEIDKQISEKTTGWTIDRFGKVELTVVRLAVYEILFEDDTPVSVSINEAVELAKKYARDESGAFVNGVLAKFAG